MPLEPGDPAPDVTAANQHGESVSPGFETTTVVYFYVEDGTPGCATQTEQFGLEAEVYEDAGVPVYGVSTDDVDSHREFAAERDIGFDLLADPDGELCEAFGVERDHAGRAERTTFVLDGGEVVRTYEGVSPDGHARDVLMDLYDSGVVDPEF
jgi:peroxiredoxin Q/BCP